MSVSGTTVSDGQFHYFERDLERVNKTLGRTAIFPDPLNQLITEYLIEIYQLFDAKCWKALGFEITDKPWPEKLHKFWFSVDPVYQFEEKCFEKLTTLFQDFGLPTDLHNLIVSYAELLPVYEKGKKYVYETHLPPLLFSDTWTVYELQEGTWQYSIENNYPIVHYHKPERYDTHNLSQFIKVNSKREEFIVLRRDVLGREMCFEKQASLMEEINLSPSLTEAGASYEIGPSTKKIIFALLTRYARTLELHFGGWHGQENRLTYSRCTKVSETNHMVVGNFQCPASNWNRVTLSCIPDNVKADTIGMGALVTFSASQCMGTQKQARHA